MLSFLPALDLAPPIPVSWSGGYLCVPVAKDGGEVRRFLLDTGTDRCYLTPKTFARLKAAGCPVAADGTMTVSGLAVGGTPLPPVVFYPEAVGYPKHSVESDADGYLGTDLLGKFRLGLNLSRNEVRLYPLTVSVDDALREFFTPSLAKHGLSAVYDKVPLTPKVSRYVAWVDAGNVSVPMVVDTGSPLTFVRSDIARSLRDAERSHSDEAHYYGGTLKYDQLRLGWVGLRGSRLGGPRRIATLDPKIGYPGVLGRDGLTPYLMLFDSAGGNLYLTDAVDRTSPPRPIPDPIEAWMPDGYTVRYPAGAYLRLPRGATCVVPDGTLEVVRADKGLDLYPSGTAWTGSSDPAHPGELPGGPPTFKTSPGYVPRWYPAIGWTEVPNAL